MARCLIGHETANTDVCDVCGARVNGIPGFGSERAAGKHRGPEPGTASDGRTCPGCGAAASGQFCDACGLRIVHHRQPAGGVPVGQVVLRPARVVVPAGLPAGGAVLALGPGGAAGPVEHGTAAGPGGAAVVMERRAAAGSGRAAGPAPRA